MAEKPREQSRATIYIGRSLPGLAQYTVFEKGQLPAHVTEMIKTNSAISLLIVPVEGLQVARRNMKKLGHVLNSYAKRLTKE